MSEALSSRAATQLCLALSHPPSGHDFSCTLLTWDGCRALLEAGVSGDRAGNRASNSTVSVLNPHWWYLSNSRPHVCDAGGVWFSVSCMWDCRLQGAWPDVVALSASLYVSQLFFTMVPTCLKSIWQLVITGGREAVTLSFIMVPSHAV